MPKEYLEYLKHILQECYYINSVMKVENNINDFLSNETLKRAIVRSIEIIGEASKQIPTDFKLKWNLINWKNMAGMRDRLIHDYMGINYNIVWDVVINKIPELTIQIENVLEREKP